MNKIPTIFVRDIGKQPALVTAVWSEGCEWVRDGEGLATRKYDGTSCMVRAAKLYKRRELRTGDRRPADFESLGTDENTGKTVGWVPVGDGPEDRWHREAIACFRTTEPTNYLGQRYRATKMPARSTFYRLTGWRAPIRWHRMTSKASRAF